MDSKAAVRERFHEVRDQIIDLGRRIHANPELGFQEWLASRWLCDTLSGAGLEVETGVCGLPTAFVARVGSGPLQVAICAEYDSLPGIGHACGHNLVAAIAVGAAIAAARVADDLGVKLSVIGTPAEEVGDKAGKILLLERGAFDGVHAAMMVHPAPVDLVEPAMIASSAFEVDFVGKEAHACGFPELGVNAADAITIAQTAIGLLRQHIRLSDRIHGIVTCGGQAPNIVPAHTRAKYMVRATTVRDLDEIRIKVLRCFEAGALATGAKLEIIGGHEPYAEMLHDHEIAALYRRNAESLGRSFPQFPGMDRAAASTDMGNVSLMVPAIHPMIGIDSLPAINHQPEFAAHCVTPAADKAVVDGSLAMAWTLIDMAREGALRQRLLSAGREAA